MQFTGCEGNWKLKGKGGRFESIIDHRHGKPQECDMAALQIMLNLYDYTDFQRYKNYIQNFNFFIIHFVLIINGADPFDDNIQEDCNSNISISAAWPFLAKTFQAELQQLYKRCLSALI